MKPNTNVPVSPLRKRRLVAVAVAVGVSTFLVAMLVQWLLPEVSRSKSGAIVVAWLVLMISLAPLVARSGSPGPANATRPGSGDS